MNFIKDLKFNILQENTKTPVRSTIESAGHDIFSSEEITIPSKSAIDVKLPFTLEEIEFTNYIATIYLRSSFGIKKKIRIIKNKFIVDGLEINPFKENIITLYNDDVKDLVIKQNEHFCQLVITNKLDKEEPFKLIDVKFEEKIKHTYIPLYKIKTERARKHYIIMDDIKIQPNEQVNFPSGLKAKIKYGTYLEAKIHEKMKSRLLLANGTGVIEADYFENETNDGLMFIAIVNKTNKEIVIPSGTELITFLSKNFYISEEENQNPVLQKRTGGVGHTG